MEMLIEKYRKHFMECIWKCWKRFLWLHCL